MSNYILNHVRKQRVQGLVKMVMKLVFTAHSFLHRRFKKGTCL